MDIHAIINTIMQYASWFLFGLYLLVLTVNIIVEVVKRLIPVPTDIVVFIVSIAVTVLAMFIAAEVLQITIMWYYAVGAVVMGIFVAYAAMFGFDKFKEILDRLGQYQK